MYEIKREKLEPLGVIELRPVDSLSDADMRKLERISAKYDFKEGEKATKYEVAIRQARTIAEYIQSDDRLKWEFEEMPLTKFLTFYTENSDERPVNFTYWLSGQLSIYLALVRDPNESASS